MFKWLRGLATGSSGSGLKTIPGVDVSSFQGLPAAWRSEAGVITWAAVKLTELEPSGVRYVNPDAAADWAYLAKQKIGRVAYMFGHPSVAVVESAEFFTTELRKIGLSDADAVMLDLEVNDGLAPAQVDAWAAKVMANLKSRLHREPILYTYLSFAEAGNSASLGRYPLWISDPSSPAGKPRVPAPWKSWTIHQYSTTGPIDRDLANFPTVAAMEVALGKPIEPAVNDLGGTIAGSVTAVRWASGIVIVAGLGDDGFVQVRRFNPRDSTWGIWRNLYRGRSLGAPALLAWGTGSGLLYYTSETGAVIELTTEDAGGAWT